jgi:hypothetical protein
VHGDHSDPVHHRGAGHVPALQHRQAVDAAVRSLRVDLVTAEVVKALQERSIRSVLLKGPALSRWLYDEDSRRPYVDADLLVGPQDLAAATSVLRALGFRLVGGEIPNDWPRHAMTWLRDDRANVDLHRTLVGVDADPTWLWEVLSERTEPMTVGGAEVAVLQPPARTLVVVLHAAKDGARVPKAMHDLAHAVDRIDLSTWQQAAALAELLNASGAFRAGLCMLPEGAVLAERLGLRAQEAAAVALRTRGAPPLSVGLDWLLTGQGGRHRLQLVGQKLVPPPAFLRAWTPLARRGPVGLALAYLWRPVWVLLHVGPALAALVRVRWRFWRQRT